MRLLHGLAETRASFDDPDLVSHAGLVPVMALAQRAGLGEMVAEHVRPGGECGVSAHVKIPCLVARAWRPGQIRSMTWTCCGTAPWMRCSAASAPGVLWAALLDLWRHSISGAIACFSGRQL